MACLLACLLACLIACGSASVRACVCHFASLLAAVFVSSFACLLVVCFHHSLEPWDLCDGPCHYPLLFPQVRLLYLVGTMLAALTGVYLLVPNPQMWRMDPGFLGMRPATPLVHVAPPEAFGMSPSAAEICRFFSLHGLGYHSMPRFAIWVCHHRFCLLNRMRPLAKPCLGSSNSHIRLV